MFGNFSPASAEGQLDTPNNSAYFSLGDSERESKEQQITKNHKTEHMNTTTRESRKSIVRVAPLLTFTFAILLASLPAASIAADPETKEHKPVIVRPSELQWSDSPALPAGVKSAFCMAT